MVDGGSPAISVRGLSKHYDQVRAVDELDLDIQDGEFFSMLGPSGSGKTTVLRLVAGFEQPTAGTVRLGDEDVTAGRRTTVTSTPSSRTMRSSRT